jgi:hypothetical protein
MITLISLSTVVLADLSFKLEAWVLLINPDNMQAISDAHFWSVAIQSLRSLPTYMLSNPGRIYLLACLSAIVYLFILIVSLLGLLMRPILLGPLALTLQRLAEARNGPIGRLAAAFITAGGVLGAAIFLAGK